jgi:ATPase subunit of ABC transporter with duplicated ATPase domains
MPAEFIYSTYKLARHYPPDRTVLEDMSISFFPGAKIGVIGPNGAGKSSLLRIMAGLDDGFTGEARLTPGFTVGYLSQEPQLDPAKDVKGNVMDGVHEVQALLDEPTNDLDVDTLRALEAGFESFPGCVVVISHDRWFLDRIATHVLAFEGDSQVRLFEGNVSDYEAFRHRELGTAADQPRRIRYKRLAR